MPSKGGTPYPYRNRTLGKDGGMYSVPDGDMMVVSLGRRTWWHSIRQFGFDVALFSARCISHILARAWLVSCRFEGLNSSCVRGSSWKARAAKVDGGAENS